MSSEVGAIDVGTSRVKGAIFDAQGVIRVFAEAPMPPLVLHGLVATQDLVAVEAAFRTVHEKIRAVPVLALTTQRGTSVAVGAENEAIGPLISWLDRRPRSELAGPKGLRSLHAQLFFQLTGRAVETTQTGVASAAVEMVPIGEIVSGVVASGGDKNSELVGAGCVKQGEAVLSFGTAMSLGMLMHGTTQDPAHTFTTAAHILGLKQVEIGLPYGGEVPGWLQRTLQAEPKPQPDPEGPLFLPYLMGSLADRRQTARWVGVSAATTPADLVTAGWAGLLLDLLYQVEALPERPTRVTLVGGGSQSPRFGQWSADAFGVPVSVKTRPDAGLAGAAMTAAIATGQALDWAAASRTYAAPEAILYQPSAAGTLTWRRLLERFRAELSCIFKPIKI